MILHAVMADQVFESAQTAGRIIIRSPDAEVLVLTVHYFPKLKSTEELWIQAGVITSTSDLRRFIAVHSICHSVSPTFSSILPAVHALTGCDSTSALFGIGKKSVFKAIYDHFSDLLTLNNEDDASALQAARKLTSALYDPKAKRTDAIQNLNNLRVKLASKKNASLI